MEVCIKGAAEDVDLGEMGQEVCLNVHRILLATDGSEPSVLATQYAVVLAKTFQAELLAIFVDTGEDALEYPEEGLSEDAFQGAHPSIKGLAIAKKLGEANGVATRIEIVKGGVAKRIVATAVDAGASMIVLGDTGRTGLKRIALGSVAETVVKGSSVPVMVVKSE